MGQHDEPIPFEGVVAEIGPELAERVRDLTIAILARGNDVAAERGILPPAPKAEFGLRGLDLAPARTSARRSARAAPPARSSSPTRCSPRQLALLAGRRVGARPPQPSYDKQYVRDWLTSAASGWDRRSGEAPPALPDEVVAATRDRYVEAYERLTGTPSCPRALTAEHDEGAWTAVHAPSSWGRRDVSPRRRAREGLLPGPFGSSVISAISGAVLRPAPRGSGRPGLGRAGAVARARSR